MMIFIDENKCTLCGACVEACPWQALSLTEGKPAVDRELCAECGACLRLCPFDAIYEVEPAPVAVDFKTEQASAAAVARPAKPETISILASPRVAPPPLWVGVLPLAARFAGSLAGWWLDRRRPSTWDEGGLESTRRDLRGATPSAAFLTGSRGIRRRWRGGRGR